MSLDLILALSFAFALYRGWRQGILMTLLYLLGTVVGLIVAFRFSHLISEWLTAQGWGFAGRSTMLGFGITFLGIGLLVRQAGRALHGITRALGLGWINKMAGAAVQVLLTALIWSSALWLGGKTGMVSAKTVQESHLYPFVAPVAPWAFSKMGVVIPAVKSGFDNLSDYLKPLTENDSMRRVDPAR